MPTPDDLQGGLTNTGKLQLIDESLTLDADGEARYDDGAGEFEMRDAIGLFNPRDGDLPSPGEAHQVLYADTSGAFTQQLPLTSCNGWLLNDNGHLLAVG